MRSIAAGFAAFATVVALAGPAAGQDRRGAQVTPLVGGMIFGDMLRGPLGTSLSMGVGPLLGVQIALPVAGPVALYGSGAWARSDIRVGIPFVGGLDIGDAEVALADAGLELRAPGPGARPFVQVGAGLAHHQVRHPVLDIQSTSVAWVAGIGVDVPLGRALSVRLLARDHVGGPDLREALFVPIEARRAHNLSLSAGLSLSF